MRIFPRALAPSLSGLALGIVWLTSGKSAHAGPVCHVAESLSEVASSEAWRIALDALKRQLDAVPDGCHGVVLTVRSETSGMRVSARSEDGAEASRFVSSPAALSAVAFGLLASAPAEPAAAEDDPLDVPPPEPPEPPPRRRRPPQPFEIVPRLDVSASFGARAGFPTDVVMGELEVRADLFIHEWLFDISMRAAPFSQASHLANDLDAYQEAGLGLGLGREVRLGRATLDLTAGANLSYIWMERDSLNLSAERAQLRLAGVTRWAYPVSPHVRVHASLDGELAPDQIVQSSYPIGLAPFPVFTVGLRIGAEVAL